MSLPVGKPAEGDQFFDYLLRDITHGCGIPAIPEAELGGANTRLALADAASGPVWTTNPRGGGEHTYVLRPHIGSTRSLGKVSEVGGVRWFAQPANAASATKLTLEEAKAHVEAAVARTPRVKVSVANPDLFA